ncbi:hypothetical protein RC62_4624 [Flavobacterium aquidurense]|uniref:Uncharacterized protein n=1 Tax=Flavobacterium aquidurense TaxID=362413 RepID=A0A0Q0W3Q3_9FLAO|nr:hypothetical protein RC62_4624 [Flavobacterium aquidurense]
MLAVNNSIKREISSLDKFNGKIFKNNNIRRNKFHFTGFEIFVRN